MKHVAARHPEARFRVHVRHSWRLEICWLLWVVRDIRLSRDWDSTLHPSLSILAEISSAKTTGYTLEKEEAFRRINAKVEQVYDVNTNRFTSMHNNIFSDTVRVAFGLWRMHAQHARADPFC